MKQAELFHVFSESCTSGAPGAACLIFLHILFGGARRPFPSRASLLVPGAVRQVLQDAAAAVRGLKHSVQV